MPTASAAKGATPTKSLDDLWEEGLARGGVVDLDEAAPRHQYQSPWARRENKERQKEEELLRKQSAKWQAAEGRRQAVLNEALEKKRAAKQARERGRLRPTLTSAQRPWSKPDLEAADSVATRYGEAQFRWKTMTALRAASAEEASEKDALRKLQAHERFEHDLAQVGEEWRQRKETRQQELGAARAFAALDLLEQRARHQLMVVKPSAQTTRRHEAAERFLASREARAASRHAQAVDQRREATRMQLLSDADLGRVARVL